MSLRITATGPGATIQDAGRRGYLRFGVTPAGPMDWVAMVTANIALGNRPGAAAIEIAGGGLTAVCEDQPVTLAFAGADFIWKRDGERLPAAGRITLQPGETLSARAGAWGGFTYIAVSGGFDIPEVMGSRATHMRSSVGGLNGRMLAAGDLLLPAGDDSGDGTDAVITAPWLAPPEEPVLVVLGPQDDHFTPEALALLGEAAFTLTPAADRMAYKFSGPRLTHRIDFNIVTDGVALGAVQVAGDGQPMVQMADRASVGGYPKIAHIARASIGQLAQLRPGQPCRFKPVPADEARDILLALEDRVALTQDYMQPLKRVPTTESLLAVNLIGGVTDGRM